MAKQKTKPKAGLKTPAAKKAALKKTKLVKVRHAIYPKVTGQSGLKVRAVRPRILMEPTLSAKKQAGSPLLRLYAIFAVVVLLATTVLWALLSAKLQHSNADQLINSYLFENFQTFRQATFPGAHSFLIKWPLFLIIRLCGPSVLAFSFFTVVISVATVAGLAYILYRIDRRPAVFGTVVLALAAVLLLVPAQPYAGAILPVNMAMLASRNIEYIIYIVSLVLVIRAVKLKSFNFICSTLFLLLLVASDKLFLTLSASGSIIILVLYGLAKRRAYVIIGLRWLLSALIAALGAAGLLWIINKTGVTHITNASGSPYGLIHNAKTAALGIIFGGLGILTNFGANPAYDAAVLRSIPASIRPRLFGLNGLVYLVNAVTFIIGLYMAGRELAASFKKSSVKKKQTDRPAILVILLAASSAAAMGGFVAADHYYVVDARYLTIVLFTIFIAISVRLRCTQLLRRGRLLAGLGIILTLSIAIGARSAVQTYKTQKQALEGINQRNMIIAQALINHPVQVLAGDYWRVLPIKDIKADTIHVMPLDDCTTPRHILSSQAWQPDLRTSSFAYVLSLDKSLTNYPACSLEQITAAYGRPNSSLLVSGTLDKPQEFLLFYDKGAHKNSQPAAAIQTVLPIKPNQIPAPECSETSILNIVAHQDDDLLFMSPDLIHDIRGGSCVRTLYITAGDAGFDTLYWQARERGSEAAYSGMLGQADTIWVQRVIKLADHQFITIASPRNNNKIALMFMRLADGSPSGRGFGASHHESLELLETAKLAQIHSVDSQSVYSSDQLTGAIKAIITIYQPSEIRTQAAHDSTAAVADHSDHMAVGRYVKKAYAEYDKPDAAIKYYQGYPIRVMNPNVADDDLAVKTAAFLEYARLDPGVCHTMAECDNAANYGAYFKRQYTTEP